MVGLYSNGDSLGDSISHMLARHCKGVVYDREMCDGVAQKLYPVVRIIYFMAVLYFLLKLVKVHGEMPGQLVIGNLLFLLSSVV